MCLTNPRCDRVHGRLFDWLAKALIAGDIEHGVCFAGGSMIASPCSARGRPVNRLTDGQPETTYAGLPAVAPVAPLFLMPSSVAAYPASRHLPR